LHREFTSTLTRQTLLSYLDDYARRGGETVFVHQRGLRTIRWSYERLANEAHKVAHELEARNIRRGERVLLCGENSPEWAATFWGCCLRGVVAVPLDKGSAREFVVSVAQQTDARLIFADRDACSAPIPLISLEDLSEQIARHKGDPYAVEGIDEDSIVEIIYTSGTTSEPKGVVLTHRNLLANLLPLEREIKKYLKWERFFHPIRFLNLVPLSHVFGQFMGLFVPPLLAGEIHFQESLNPSEIVRTTRKNRISVIVLVPRVLDAVREWVERDYAARGQAQELQEQVARMENKGLLHKWWSFRHLHRRFGWKFWAFVSGGATLGERTETFWRRLGFAVLQGYGMTETSALISVNHPFKGSSGSIGRLMPGHEVKLDESGEIMVRGASVSPGYWTTEGGINTRANEWLRTGDIGEFDASGNLFFKGRQKDVIVGASGLNIYPEDLEAALDRQPEVRASCVIAIDGPRGSEPFAVIIPQDRDADVVAAIGRANAQLAEFQQVRRWSIWSEPDFPRTTTHKILKREVAARIKASGARTNGSVSSNATEAASTVLASEIARIGGDVPAALDVSARLSDLQLDSLGRVELLSALEDRYQISLDEAAFTAATTVGDVQRVVRGEVEAQVSTPYPYPKWTRWLPVKWLRVLLYYTIILPVTHVMSRMSVAGRNHVKDLKGPALFVVNHVTLGDHALVLAALPARLRHRVAIAMEGEQLRDWLNPPPGTNLSTRLRWRAQYVLVNLFFHVFPLPKKSGFRQSFAYAGECVDRGESVLIFPEGTRAQRGKMHMGPFKAGIGVLAQSLNIPVVPVRLEGLYKLKRRKQYFADPGMVKVIFGEPVRFSSDANPTRIAHELESRVAHLATDQHESIERATKRHTKHK
jgi:long-chain acyl-CoA synthetase